MPSGDRNIRIGQGADAIPPWSGDLSKQAESFSYRQEIQLTAKEYEILLLLAANKGHVLTYNQIYEKVWGDCPSGSENNPIGFHICNLREKLYQAAPNAPFTIRSVREVGYCFEIQAEN